MTSKPENKELIHEFVSRKKKNLLESYIRDEKQAWAEDLNGETRVYLIKDRSGKIAMFFSVKCGLLVMENSDEKLSEDQRSFVEALIEVMNGKDEKAVRGMYDAGCSLYGDEIDRLFETAKRRIKRKNEAFEIGQSENTINVPNCISAIELRHFCRNENYPVPDELGIPLGFGLFWEAIVPLLTSIIRKIGCKYIYLFAADKTENQENDFRELVSYYKNSLKFSECDEGMKFIKPDYDNNCYGLVQEVSMLELNREAIWQEFSDV